MILDSSLEIRNATAPAGLIARCEGNGAAITLETISGTHLPIANRHIANCRCSQAPGLIRDSAGSVRNSQFD